MKIDNKTEQREEEAREREEKRRAEQKQKDRMREDSIVPKLGFYSDWRVEQEYGKLPGVSIIWNTHEHKKNYLRDVLNKRNNIDELVVDEHDRKDNTSRNLIEIEVSLELFQQISKEAAALGIGAEEYVRAIYYTTALRINQKREKHLKEFDERVERERPVWTEGNINGDMKNRLIAKYGAPKGHEYMGISADAWLNLLIKIADERLLMLEENKD